MISPQNITLKPFDESAYLKFMSDVELIIDGQLSIPWDINEKQRIITLPAFPDLRYYNRMRQEYEAIGWLLSNLFLDCNTNIYFTTFSKSH